jgi:hypothetical protein
MKDHFEIVCCIVNPALLYGSIIEVPSVEYVGMMILIHCPGAPLRGARGARGAWGTNYA